MKLFFQLVAPLLAAVLISGCSPMAFLPQPPQPAIALGHKVDLSNSTLVESKLKSQYQSWAGVRHRTGGMTKKGIDCSALVYITFKEQLGIELPRSAAMQAKVGSAIDKNQLRPGDLVFFKTQLINRHVGVYMGAGKFMHVSSSKGVMVSQLRDYYWAKKYWQARRVET